MTSSYICASCRRSLQIARGRDVTSSIKRWYNRPSFAPKPVIDLKHIRQNPGLYEQNAIDRNYAPQAQNGWRILELHEKDVEQQRQAVQLRQRNNAIGKEVGRQAAQKDVDNDSRSTLLEEAKALKQELASFEAIEKESHAEMGRLALELPNLSSMSTPVGQEPHILEVINEGLDISRSRLSKSHVDIGKELDILDFEASATTSGWGWYFLKNEGALLEQALIQYALSVAMKRGFKVMTPPSLVYSHIASACGFMPRDQNGETQIYNIAQHEHGHSGEKPGMVLTGTAEIPFAGSQANKTLQAADLPLKVVGPSRCYRAEAGARGVDTKGLYRVHEFTKVEMFAWTLPSTDSDSERFSDDEGSVQAEEAFADMLDIQKEIIISLGLHAKVLEMPTADLGASASRKIDIEAFFPSRQSIDDGYGEVTSASICTDYQSRRLGTRLKHAGAGKIDWPYTINGTALAVPRVLACILENHWNDEKGELQVPEVLRQYMPGNIATISRKTEDKSQK
ncbi:Serine--tRNA ligase, mitochondrial [Fulvia fulva]|uniref:serine--tRNA ligase n=1 Tax=Passalora fulva TaxID=5499 RepID=A0A9Q8UUK2_PASFU|nr:Serine--tRNA ligase, mitochondrial [Fulvia fulva]KAK4626513.1 Serine--tRNA ligase, mitochondrial [Fulvia fulva]KAK4628645.1 Serine--tRNA ligase, mitochondrial [Fulvia fulva]UJO23021.1 Serine--tRNA ligase, mitochondrial [Fulvia fulva]WPV13301.1 Serine--tRNA ligase, mitochondrial [Fulvia fulva]WPV28337.1 Serine--tRNA ligase, mitochondrial [Fulvia fulva]